MRGLAGVRVDPKQVERTAEALGREIAADERERREPEPPAEARKCLHYVIRNRHRLRYPKSPPRVCVRRPP